MSIQQDYESTNSPRLQELRNPVTDVKRAAQIIEEITRERQAQELANRQKRAEEGDSTDD